MTSTAFEESAGVRGAQPVGETHVAYVRYPNGGLGRISQTGRPVEPTAGGVLISQAEYEAELGELDAGRAAYLAEVVAGDEANTAADYRELRGAGVAEASARRMSGYTGPGDGA